MPLAGNYMFRYFLAAAGSACVLPAIDRIGVGWFSTVSALFLVVSAIGTHCTAVWGRTWRDRVDARKQNRKCRGRSSEASRDQDEKTAEGDDATLPPEDAGGELESAECKV